MPPGAIGKIATAIVLILPAVGVGAAVVNIWHGSVDLRAVAVGIALYLISGLGITAGYHRLFTHTGYVAKRPLKIALAIAGSLAVEGSVSSWVANHRVHHQRSDQPGDPHSPWASTRLDGPRTDGATWRGFWHAQCLWLFRAAGANIKDRAGDIVGDKDLRRLSTWFGPIALSGILVPFAAGWLIGGSVQDGFWWAVWAGGVRIFLLHHVTWLINSACHMVGKRPFNTGDRSTNVWWLALPSLGESWHNAHHQFPNLARHGISRFQPDPTAWFIRGCERIGWVTKVRWPNARTVALASR